MRVILLDNVDNLGKKGDVKNVRAGYARNFLIPKGLAKIANAADIKQSEEEKKQKEAIAVADLEKTEQLAEALEGYELMLQEKVGDAGKLYAAVTANRLAKELQNKKFDVGKGNIKLVEPIKDLGEYDVVLELDHGLEAKIKVIVEAQKPK